MHGLYLQRLVVNLLSYSHWENYITDRIKEERNISSREITVRSLICNWFLEAVISKDNHKVLSVPNKHIMHLYRGNGGTAPLILKQQH